MRTLQLLFCLVVMLVAHRLSPADQPNILLLMADNWAWPHASCLGDPVVKTPAVDEVASRGVVFDHAFCLAPSCAPARAALLTGQTIHRLGSAANLQCLFPTGHQVLTDQLRKSGYQVAYSGKGWAPGRWAEAGWDHDPSGEKVADFESFLASVETDRPFFYWFSSREPHIPWQEGEKRKANMRAAEVRVPAYLPDNQVTRDDILNYYCEVELFDEQVAEHLRLLQASGRESNTLIVICGDNGWQMPHGLAHVYDAGTRVPLIVAGPGVDGGGRVCSELVNFDDLAPTFLAMAGAEPLTRATGTNLEPLLSDRGATLGRTCVYLSRERHANVRAGNAAYPVRAIRTPEFLYVRNFRPELWPAGDPEQWFAVGPYGDVDYTYVKRFILEHQDEPAVRPYYAMNFGKRPAEELYDLRSDPDQTFNVAGDSKYQQQLSDFSQQLDNWMQQTEDPRATDPQTDFWDKLPYFGHLGTPTSQRPRRELEALERNE